MHKRVSNHTFHFLLDKVNQRLSIWKAEMLSMAGRVTLAKSALQAIPSYIMQTVAFSARVFDEIDRKCRAFVWGDDDQHGKAHTFPWNELCEPKSMGGLGLKSTRAMNNAFFWKHVSS